MKIHPDGNITAFCCKDFDRATLQPNKSISIQPLWKDNFLDTPHPRACLMVFKTGRTIEYKTGIVRDSGFNLIPIEFCPFCKKELTFEEVKEKKPRKKVKKIELVKTR